MTTIALVGTEGGSSRLLAAPSECGCCIQYNGCAGLRVAILLLVTRSCLCCFSVPYERFWPMSLPPPSPPLGDVPLERCARCARPPSPPSALSALLADLHRPSVVLQHTGSTQTHHTLSTPSSLSSSLAMADFVKCVCSETGGGWLADRADGVSAVAASAHHRQKGTQMLM